MLPEAVAYWRLVPVTQGEAKARKTAAPIYCVATAELVQMYGGPDKAVSRRVYDTLVGMRLVPSLVEGERHYLMHSHLNEIGKIAEAATTPEEWEEARDLIVKLVKIATEE